MLGAYTRTRADTENTGVAYGEDDPDAETVTRVEPDYTGGAFQDAFEKPEDEFRLTGADYVHTGALLLWAATEGLSSRGDFPGHGTPAFDKGAELVTDYAEELLRLGKSVGYGSITFDRVRTALVPLVHWNKDGTVGLPSALAVLDKAAA